jgi:hypothetical protein
MTLIRTLIVYIYVIAVVIHNAGYYQKVRSQEDVLGADVVQQKIHDRARKAAARIMKLSGANMKVVGKRIFRQRARYYMYPTTRALWMCRQLYRYWIVRLVLLRKMI